MSTPDLAYIAFTIMFMGLVVCFIYISHLRHQNSELYSVVMKQDALINVYDRHTQDNDEYVQELSVQLEAASACADEYRAALRHIDNQLQSDPIQFIHTIEESPRV